MNDTILNDGIVYVVNAYRDGLREKHSYTVAVFSSPGAAMVAAELHCNYRGGKYSTVVEKHNINPSNPNDNEPVMELYRAKGRNDNSEYHLDFVKSKLGKK